MSINIPTLTLHHIDTLLIWSSPFPQLAVVQLTTSCTCLSSRSFLPLLAVSFPTSLQVLLHSTLYLYTDSTSSTPQWKPLKRKLLKHQTQDDYEPSYNHHQHLSMKSAPKTIPSTSQLRSENTALYVPKRLPNASTLLHYGT